MEQKYPTIPQALDRSKEKFGCLVYCQMRTDDGTYRSFTYEAFHDAVQKLSAFMAKQGVGYQERVALLSENRPEWPMTYYGAANTGRVVVPLDPKLEPLEIKNFILDSGSKMIFVSNELLEKVEAIKEGLPGLKVVNIDKDYAAILSEKSPSLPDRDKVKDEDLAVIIYTSGTTGKPKGVMLTHRNIMSNCVESCKIFHMLGPGDNFLSVLPAYHTFESIVGMFAAFYLGAKVTYAESLKSHSLLRNMQETGVTMIAAVPLLYTLFYDGIWRSAEEKGKVSFVLLKALFGISKFCNDILGFNPGRKLFGIVHKKFGGKIRYFVSGGAALDRELIRNFGYMGFEILQGYGLTETSPVLAFTRIDDNVAGTVGKALPGIELKLDGISDDGVGEIIARGPNVMKGYYRNPEATAEVIRDGWFHTGDLGKFDKNGNLMITGRSKDVIVLGSGVNVYPDEVEFTLSKSPYIVEICVFGSVIKDGARKGMEEVAAAVFPNIEKISFIAGKAGAEADEKFVRELVGGELDKYGKYLTDYKRVAKYYISKEELPKTPKRSIKRFAVKKMYS